MNKKLVVLTGSFNPITKAHRLVIENAINKVNADLGLLVIVSDDYLKNKIIIKKKEKRPFILSEELRKEMIDSLQQEFPKIKYGGIEVGGASPATVKTLTKIKKKYSNYDLYFSIGADKLESFSHWTNVEDIFENLHLIVYPRVGYNIENIIKNDSLLFKNKNKIIILDEIKESKGISSTKIRELFFSNLEFKEFMDKGPYEVFKKLNISDYKEITGEDLIKYQLIYGGRFGGNAARKQVYLENVKLFNNWDNKLFGSRDDLISNTKVYKEEFIINTSTKYETKYCCDNIDCVDNALNLIKEGLNPVILNLASNRTPCGGYFSGSNGQEESLCEMSTLSLSLYQFANPNLKCFKDAKVNNISGVYPMDINFGGIYSPRVSFFRNNIDKYYSLRDEIFKCSVISVASLSNKIKDKYINLENKYFSSDGYLTIEGKNIEKNKIRTILKIAAINNHDSIILGAFGCGDFNLRPDEVALLFKEVLEESEFKNVFKVVSFAIYEGKGSKRKVVGENGKFKPFYDLFDK